MDNPKVLAFEKDLKLAIDKQRNVPADDRLTVAEVTGTMFCVMQALAIGRQEVEDTDEGYWEECDDRIDNDCDGHIDEGCDL